MAKSRLSRVQISESQLRSAGRKSGTQFGRPYS